MLKRTVIAAVWVAGATVPLMVAVVFVFGCCVLPFHGVIHKLMPLCDVALNVIGGEHRAGSEQQPLPAREKQEPVKRMVTEVPRAFQLTVMPAARHRARGIDAISYRSFIALGALRCDQDVGLHLLVATLLI